MCDAYACRSMYDQIPFCTLIVSIYSILHTLYDVRRKIKTLLTSSDMPHKNHADYLHFNYNGQYLITLLLP